MSKREEEKKTREFKKGCISSDDLFNRKRKYESIITSSELNETQKKIRIGNSKKINSSELNKKSKKIND